MRPRDADVMWRTNERGDAEVDLLPIPLVRKYIAYARKYCKPLSGTKGKAPSRLHMHLI